MLQHCYMDNWYRVFFEAPNKLTYELTGRADNARHAVRLADLALEGLVEDDRIGDHLEPDGVSVRAPAKLSVEPAAADETGSGFGLVIRDRDGRVLRRR